MTSRIALLAGSILASVLASPVVASAAPAAGGLGVLPAKGTDQSVVEVETTGPCPVGVNLQATIYGRGFPAGGQRVVSNSPTGAYERNATGGYSIPLAMTLRDFVNLQPNPVPLAGTYRLVVICRDNVKVGALAEFAGSITFSNPRTYAAARPRVPLKPFERTGGAPPSASGAPAGLAPPGPADPGGTGPEVPPSAALVEQEKASAAQSDGASTSLPGSSSLLLVLGGAVAAGGVGVAAGFRPKRRTEREVA